MAGGAAHTRVAFLRVVQFGAEPTKEVTELSREPRAFRRGVGIDAEGADRLRATIAQAAAAPGALVPREEFVTGLHGQLRAGIDRSADDDVPGRGPAPSGLRRRRVLQVAAGLVGAAAVGAAGERAVNHPGKPAAGSALVPDNGRWTPVTTAADLSARSALSFSVGHVVGVVADNGGNPAAVSAVCTHQGCLLRLDDARRQLACPCHNTVFSLSGEVLHHSLRNKPAPLPPLRVREREGRVEVLLPG